MKELALITGASGGIGLEIAKLLAAKKIDLIIVARREAQLQALKQSLESEHGIQVHVFAKDLSVTQNPIALYQEIKAQGLAVTILINNAGFGLWGEFTETALETELNMIQLNLSALVSLCKLFGKDMKAQKQGRILNIASLLSFFPFPYFSVYAASKAFVLSFSEAFATELEGTNVTVTAACPGPVDTEFASEDMLKSNAYQSIPVADSKTVAEQSLAAMFKGKKTTVIGLMPKILSSTPRFSPRSLILKINKFNGSRKG
jgi:short-subunit dehydrogenase